MLVSVCAAAVAAAGYVGVLRLGGFVETSQIAEGVARFVVGDLIGMLIVTPTILLAASRRLSLKLTWETVGQLAMIILALVAIFGLSHASEYQLFYLLFIPLLWSAFSNGVAGAALALCVIQAGLITIVHSPFMQPGKLMSFQILMIWLAATGLVFGGVVLQQQAAAARLRYQQMALARALRLQSMGEVASTIAHEVNQPLTSIKALAGVLGREMAAEAPAVPRDTIEKIRSECDRASQIIRATRNALRHQVFHPEPIMTERLLAEAGELVSDRLTALDVGLRTKIDPDVERIHGDRVQLSQALYNLLDNSLQAIEDSAQPGSIDIIVRSKGTKEVEFEIRDTGPGFQPALLELGLPPLVSTRKDGTGIGLSVVRSIAEAHGGKLTVNQDGNATSIRFTTAKPEQNDYAENSAH